MDMILGYFAVLCLRICYDLFKIFSKGSGGEIRGVASKGYYWNVWLPSCKDPGNEVLHVYPICWLHQVYVIYNFAVENAWNVFTAIASGNCSMELVSGTILTTSDEAKIISPNTTCSSESTEEGITFCTDVVPSRESRPGEAWIKAQYL